LRVLRTIATALLIAAGLALGLMPAAAHAAGPGVTLFVNTDPQPIDIPGSRFAGGVSIRSLLMQHGIDPATVSFVTVTREDGGLVTLSSADIAGGGAVITDDGTTTRFVRGGAKVVANADSGPLQVNVNSGDVSVSASVNRSKIRANERATFSASVRFAPPGAALTFEWDFGDGSAPKIGSTVSHVYRTPGSYQARVAVRGSGGTTQRCARNCTGTDGVVITVGDPPQQPATGAPGAGGTGDPNAAGSSGGTGGGGQGGSGGSGSGTGTTPSTTPDEAAPKPLPPPPPQKLPFGVTISGVLINDLGAKVSELPSGRPAGAPKGQRQTGGGDADVTVQIPLAGLLALTLFTLGALRERRGVKLRLA
jgi:hypothetical protein